MGDKARNRDFMAKLNELVRRQNDLEKQLLSARRSSWETAAILRVVWDFLTEHFGKKDANERLGQAFEDLSGGLPENFEELTNEPKKEKE